MKNYGYQNELDFVKLFNNKFLNELDSNSQKFLKNLFGDVIKNDERIKSWKNNANQKADVFIKYKAYVKSISIKCGTSNSIHCEEIQEFKRFLEKIPIPYYIVNYYLSYHYGHARDSLDNVIYDSLLSAEEYKSFFQNEINIFNNSINKTKIIIEMIDRFIIRGKNSDYDIDALVCGKVDDYVWILKYDLYDLVLENRRDDYTSPHIACMTLGPKKRNLDRKERVCKERYLVVARWTCIRDDIINFKIRHNIE
jgi:hypothetical protein